jgi:hypothetical protein
MHPTTGHPLLGIGSVNIFRVNEYATIGKAVFSVVCAVLVATIIETVFSAWSMPKV